MKAFILTSIVLSIYATGLSQQSDTKQVYKFKAFQTSIYKTPLKDANEISWDNTDILVVINLDKRKIKIFAKTNVDLDIIKTYKNEVDADGNDELWYDVIDEDGEKCEVNVVIFKDQSNSHTATLLLKYTGLTIAYRLKKDD